jgi:hypothetical protein
MSQVILPLDQNAPWFSFRIILNTIRYGIEARFNIRMNRWIMSIYDAGGAPVLMGIPLLIDRNLIPYPTLKLPSGAMFVKDASGKQLQATLASFAVDHLLVQDDLL